MKNTGFTLLEMILTIFILVVGSMSLIQAVNAAMFADSLTEDHIVAVQLAQEKMEEIKNAGSYAAIDGFVSARGNLGGDFADFDREVTISGDPKEVQVNVYWGPAGEQQNVSLVTLVADYNF